MQESLIGHNNVARVQKEVPGCMRAKRGTGMSIVRFDVLGQ